jgi:hypothetical protein
MTIQHNQFNSRLPALSRSEAAEKPAAAAAATSSASAGSTATQAPALPVGLVGNHVNTTA